MSDQQGQSGLKVAVIGAGYFARFHHEAWKRHPRADLVAVVDQDLEKAKTVGVSAYQDLGALFEAQQTDLIDIATPPQTHLALIQQAIEHGCRAIICQKPFCGTLDQAEQAVRLAAEADVSLVVHENFRFQPWYRALRRELAQGRIGRVMNLTFRLRPGDGQGKDAYLARQPYFQKMEKFLIHETGVHWIDTFRYLLGEPEWVFADLRKMNPIIAGEDAGTVLFGYPGGTRALFDGNRLLDHPAENRRLTMGECSVEGEKGEIRILGNGSLLYRPFGENGFDQLTPPTPEGIGFGGDCVYALQDHVVAGVLDGSPLENLAGSYTRNMRIESAIYQSAEEGRRISITL